MKKKLKFLYALLIISVGLQTIVYFSIDRFLYARDIGMGSIKYSHGDSTGTESLDISVPVPKNAKNICVSDDLGYVAYITDGKLKILETRSYDELKTVENNFYNRETKKFDTKSSGTVTFAKWVPGKNILMYLLSSTESSNGRVQLFSYNADSGGEFQGVDIKGNLSKGSTGVDIIISPLNMITYIKVKTSNTAAKIYRTDINNDIFEPFAADLESHVRIGHYNDTVIFSGDNNKLYQKNGTNAPQKLKYDKKGVILDIAGIDNEGKDMVYIGETDSDGKVVKILNGLVGTDISKWVQTPLNTPVSPENLLISYSANILEVIQGKKENVIKNLGNNKEAKFSGELLYLIGDKIIYLDGNKVKSKSF